jgi:hypothetical protein
MHKEVKIEPALALWWAGSKHHDQIHSLVFHLTKQAIVFCLFTSKWWTWSKKSVHTTLLFCLLKSPGLRRTSQRHITSSFILKSKHFCFTVILGLNTFKIKHESQSHKNCQVLFTSYAIQHTMKQAVSFAKCLSHNVQLKGDVSAGKYTRLHHQYLLWYDSHFSFSHQTEQTT